MLDLGGYYVKFAQTLCGMGLLPPAYDAVFSAVVLDNVPQRDFAAVIAPVIRQELGVESLDDVFVPGSFGEGI